MENLTNMFKKGTSGLREQAQKAQDSLGSHGSIIGKFVFIIFILILFIYALKLVTSIIGYFFSENPNPVLIKGMRSGMKGIIIQQDPNKKGAIPILRSNNEDSGIEFTYTLWIFIDNLGNTGKKQHIFHKGNGDYNTADEMFSPNYSPALYLDGSRTKNKMHVYINTYQNLQEKVEIDNLPIKKWMFVTIRVSGGDTQGNKGTMDVYINGTIAKRLKLTGHPKQNYGPVYVTQRGGFNGAISTLRYFNYALDVQKIKDMTNAGPDLTVHEDSDRSQSKPPYFSLRWYLNIVP